MQKEYVIQFYKTINKVLCNLSFAGQYILQNCKKTTWFENVMKTKSREVCRWYYVLPNWEEQLIMTKTLFLVVHDQIQCSGIQIYDLRINSYSFSVTENSGHFHCSTYMQANFTVLKNILFFIKSTNVKSKHLRVLFLCIVSTVYFSIFLSGSNGVFTEKIWR